MDKDSRTLKQEMARAEKLTPRPTLLKSGRWRCRVMINGEHISVVDDTPERAHARAIAQKAGIIQRDRERSAASITLTAAIDKYIDDRRNLLSPATIRGYRAIQDNRFAEIMQLRVASIDRADLQRAINQDAKTVSAKTLRNSMGLIQSVISQYKEINCTGLKYPQRVKKEHAYLDGQQIGKLITAIQGDPMEIPILLALWLGLRRSEIMGLTWEAVDFDAKNIRIQSVVVQGEDGAYVQKGETKNESSRRTLPCPDYILDKLLQYQPDKSSRNGLIFKFDPCLIYNHLKKCSNEAGIPFVGVHGLRHTNASIMLSMGIMDKVAMQRGGWATKDTMQQIYQHVFASDRSVADKLINAYFDDLIEDS